MTWIPQKKLTRFTAATMFVYCIVGIIGIFVWEGVAPAFDYGYVGSGSALVSHSKFVRNSVAALDMSFEEHVRLCAVRGCVDFVGFVGLSKWDGKGGSTSR